MNNEQKLILARIIASGSMLIVFNFMDISGTYKLIAYLVPYIIAGYDVLLEALEGISEHEIFDENFLMSVATIGALCLAVFYDGEYFEAVAVMLFYQVGEFFQDIASERSRRSITDLMNIRPDYANLERNNTLERVDPDEVEEGSIIIIKPGEKIPIDGIILEGTSSIDTGALTGESIPKNVNLDDEVLSGSINLSGLLRVRTTRKFHDSTASRILELVENAASRKSISEKFISRFAEVYTPIVCYSALALAVIPSIMFGNFGQWLYRALTFLVISCPCALVISIPLSFFAGIGGMSRAGILVKGSDFIEKLSGISCAVFDKTGTLTQGVFEVTAVHPEVMNEEELLHIASHAERYSNHPAADSLRRAYPNESDSCDVEDFEEIPGYGVRAKVNGSIVCAGSSRFMDMIKADWHPCTKSGTIIHVSVDGIYAGHIVISDIIKPNSIKAVKALRSMGINHIVMLTGDSRTAAEEAGKSIGIDEVYSELLPADKVNKVEELLNSGHTAFIGDGINDAPVLSRSDVGIAMGALGSDAAIEAADVVLMDDDPLKVPEAVRISRKCMSIVRENIYFSVGVKVLCLVMSALGIAGMGWAVFADVGVMVLAVTNSIRAMFVKKAAYIN